MSDIWPGITFPHPPGRKPLVGDILGADRKKPLQNILKRSQGLGPISEIKIFGQRLVFVTGTDLAIELSDEKRFQKGLSPAVEGLRDFVGDGLFTAYNDEPNWQLAHDLLRPAFSRPAMQTYHETMLGVIRELVSVWDGTVGPVDVSPALTKVTMETIGRTAFSHDFGSFTTEGQHPFVTAMIAALKSGQQRVVLGAMPFGDRLMKRAEKRNEAHQQYIDTMLDDLIAERRANDDQEERDLLGIMLNTAHPESGDMLDDLNIRYQILTFLVAGHETTSGALSFALYYLSRNPEALAKAQAETDAILGADPDAEPTFEQVAKFRYVRRVLDESLRLWPTVPAFARSPREDTVIGGTWPMRKDDWAIVLFPPVHRDPAIWGDDADEFEPDRFLSENVKARPAHTYMPFGVGERACIGRQFAIHEAVLVLARLLHRYEISGDPGYELEINERLTLMPEGFELSLSRRVPAASMSAEGQDTVLDQTVLDQTVLDQGEESETCPVSSIDQPGFQATSQGCPSGSAK